MLWICIFEWTFRMYEISSWKMDVLGMKKHHCGNSTWKRLCLNQHDRKLDLKKSMIGNSTWKRAQRIFFLCLAMRRFTWKRELTSSSHPQLILIPYVKSESNLVWITWNMTTFVFGRRVIWIVQKNVFQLLKQL